MSTGLYYLKGQLQGCLEAPLVSEVMAKMMELKIFGAAPKPVC